MRIRVYPTDKYDLETVAELLYNADAQTNFHVDARWIMASGYGEETFDPLASESKLTYRELFVKWIGREAVVMWLVSNQILFKITSYKLLPEEEEALEASQDADFLNPNELN